MCLNLNEYQFKISKYIYMLTYMSYTVTTNQKLLEVPLALSQLEEWVVIKESLVCAIMSNHIQVPVDDLYNLGELHNLEI